LRRAAIDAIRKLDPRLQAKNPVMFVVAAGATLTTILVIVDLARGNTADLRFNIQITLWLWFTVLFANFAEAIAEGRGKAQADSLRKTRQEMTARQLIGSNGSQKEERVPASQLKATWLFARRAIRSRETAKSSRASPASTSRPSPANPRTGHPRERRRPLSAVTGGTRVLSDRSSCGHVRARARPSSTA
jgi:potassium-transporting ATPase ATP-binding subunit